MVWVRPGFAQTHTPLGTDAMLGITHASSPCLQRLLFHPSLDKGNKGTEGWDDKSSDLCYKISKSCVIEMRGKEASVDGFASWLIYHHTSRHQNWDACQVLFPFVGYYCMLVNKG